MTSKLQEVINCIQQMQTDTKVLLENFLVGDFSQAEQMVGFFLEDLAKLGEISESETTRKSKDVSEYQLISGLKSVLEAPIEAKLKITWIDKLIPSFVEYIAYDSGNQRIEDSLLSRFKALSSVDWNIISSLPKVRTKDGRDYNLVGSVEKDGSIVTTYLHPDKAVTTHDFLKYGWLVYFVSDREQGNYFVRASGAASRDLSLVSSERLTVCSAPQILSVVFGAVQGAKPTSADTPEYWEDFKRLSENPSSKAMIQSVSGLGLINSGLKKVI